MQSFEKILEKTNEYGVIEELKYPLVTVSGLPTVKPNEIVIFYNDMRGQVFAILPDAVQILLLDTGILEVKGKVTRTGELLTILGGAGLIGSIIDPLGTVLYSTKPTKNTDIIHLHSQILGIPHRKKINQLFQTGVSLVDLMIPLAKGQRELILGDRKTGKTSFLLSTMKRQVEEGAVVIYTAIGKKKNDIKKMQDSFIKLGIMDRVIMVVSDPQSPASIVYLTPYTAMAVAEYFRDTDRDVVLILDDLSTHAKYYREISLLAGNFPGRDSYPGDIFYKHSHLLEKAGNFISKKGQVSITCLPVAETVEGDVAGYITTNLMGMTDGHIYFDNNIFALGRRPAINIPLSVTRVGRQVQTPLKKELFREINTLLSQYEKLVNYSHFGAELSPKVQEILKKGDMIFTMLEQHYTENVPESVQLLLMGLVWGTELEGKTKEDIISLKQKIIAEYSNKEKKEAIDGLITAVSLAEFLTAISNKKALILS